MEAGAKRLLGIDRSVEPGLPELDGAHKRHGACWGSMCKRKVCVLITLSDEGTQIATGKAVLGDDLRPHISVVANVRCKAGRLIRSRFNPKRLCHRRPRAPPLEDVTVSDVEYFVRRLRRLRGPQHYLAYQVGVSRLPDERRASGEAERLALLPADGGVHTDSRKDVQGSGSLAGDELRPQHRIGETVLRAHFANVVLLVEEEARMVVARIALAGRDGNRMKVHAVGLRSLQDGYVLKR